MDVLLDAFNWFQGMLDRLTAIGFAWTYLAAMIAAVVIAFNWLRERLRSPGEGGGPSRRRRS